jgi:hypothetical protein
MGGLVGGGTCACDVRFTGACERGGVHLCMWKGGYEGLSGGNGAQQRVCCVMLDVGLGHKCV